MKWLKFKTGIKSPNQEKSTQKYTQKHIEWRRDALSPWNTHSLKNQYGTYKSGCYIKTTTFIKIKPWLSMKSEFKTQTKQNHRYNECVN